MQVMLGLLKFITIFYYQSITLEKVKKFFQDFFPFLTDLFWFLLYKLLWDFPNGICFNINFGVSIYWNVTCKCISKLAEAVNRSSWLVWGFSVGSWPIECSLVCFCLFFLGLFQQYRQLICQGLVNFCISLVLQDFSSFCRVTAFKTVFILKNLKPRL